MTATDRIEFHHLGIGEVLANNSLQVPPNQREYSWEEEHVQDLFADFANAISQGQGHFLGTIVFTNRSGDAPEVSDGQQRLATTTILLAAMRDHFHENNDSKRRDHIEQTYLSAIDPDTTETIPKLRMNVDDNSFFVKRILSRPDSPDRSIERSQASHDRIKVAAEMAARHIRRILEPHKPEYHAQRLVELLRFIRKDAEVITLSVPDHMNAFTMFETLNDRGLKASQADLLKNYLLGETHQRMNEAQQYWSRMVGTIDSLGLQDMPVTFLHHMLITKQGPTKASEVYDRVKRTINSEQKALEFLGELSNAANDYAALFNSDHAKWHDYGTVTRKHIATFNRDLSVIKQIRPLMFAVARHFEVKEARIAFRRFVCWSVRILIVGKRGGTLDTAYALRAQEVASGKIKTAEELTSALGDIIPSDALFAQAFAEARVSLPQLARYYLRAMERKIKGEPEAEWVPSDDEHEIDLEHILPENPEKWADIDAETAAAWYKRIGNMVLMKHTKNSLVGNAVFSEKRPELAKSAYTLTNAVGKDYDRWGTAEIEERQTELAALAVDTWPIRA